MKYYTLYREDNDFSEILKDAAIKKHIFFKVSFHQHLIIGLNREKEKVIGYIVLKYGEYITNLIEKDYTPIPGVDYIPQR